MEEKFKRTGLTVEDTHEFVRMINEIYIEGWEYVETLHKERTKTFHKGFQDYYLCLFKRV